jgi:carnitine O-acetyltransferase
VEEFWNDSYLAPDCSLVLNLNPFFVLEEGPDPDQDRTQLGRASSLVYAALLFVSTLKRQELTPDAFRATSLCMDQFQSLFGSCRIPVVGDKDHVEVDPNSSHVVVLVKSRMYYFQGLWPEVVDAEQVDGCGNSGAAGADNGDHKQERAVVATSRDDILDILQAIVRDVEDASDDDAAEESAKNAVGVLTTLPRKEWAKARYILLEQSEHNKQVMQVIDSALFVLVLDDYSPSNVDQTAENMLQGSYQLANRSGSGGTGGGSSSNGTETPAAVRNNRNNSFMTSNGQSRGGQGWAGINCTATSGNRTANSAAHPQETESLLSYQVRIL